MTIFKRPPNFLPSLRHALLAFAILAASFAQIPAQAWDGVSPPVFVVFYSSHGKGHESAAHGIASQLEKEHPGAIVHVKDIRDFSNPLFHNVSGQIYDAVTKHTPRFYTFLFEGYLHLGRGLKSWANRFAVSSYHPEKMLEYIEEKKPDVLISTISFGAEAIIQLQDDGHLPGVPVVWQHTDLVRAEHFESIAKNIDLTILGTQTLQGQFVQDGVPADRVAGYGMPMRDAIYAPFPDDERRAFMAEKGLTPGLKRLTLISGAAGVGPFPRMVQDFADRIEGPVELVVICGENQSHFDTLRKMEPALRAAHPGLRLKILASAPNADVLRYFRLSDLVVTKSGGLTPFEVAVLNRKLLELDINGGQEIYNARAFEDDGLAIVNRDLSKLGIQANMLLKDTLPEDADRAYTEDELAYFEMGATMLKNQRNFAENIRTDLTAHAILDLARASKADYAEHPVPVPGLWARCAVIFGN